MNANENTHTDTMDATFEISLHEYGIVRDPNTSNTVFCLNTTDDFADNHKYRYNDFNISFEDVKEELQDVEDGYFDFIGSTREKELAELDNNYLAHHIFSLNQYCGTFITY